MTRLKPLPQEEWDERTRQTITGGRAIPQNNALSLLAHHPRLAGKFLAFNQFQLTRATLPERTRELAILRVAWRRRCRYEWAQHVVMAKEVGITDEEIAQVRSGAPTLVTRAVDELEVDFRLSDETYAALSAELDDQQLLEFVLVVGTYGMLAQVFNTFDLDLEPGVPDGGFPAGS